jgi:hypothetical protein
VRVAALLAFPVLAVALAGCTCPTSTVTWHDARLYFATPGNATLSGPWYSTQPGPASEPMPLADAALDSSWGEYRLERVSHGEVRTGRTHFLLVGREVSAHHPTESGFADDQVQLPSFLRALGVRDDQIPALRGEMAGNLTGVLESGRDGARSYVHFARLPDYAAGAQAAWDGLGDMASSRDADDELGRVTLERDDWAFHFAIPSRNGDVGAASYVVDADGQVRLQAYGFSKEDGGDRDLVRFTQDALAEAGLPVPEAQAIDASVGGC